MLSDKPKNDHLTCFPALWSILTSFILLFLVWWLLLLLLTALISSDNSSISPIIANSWNQLLKHSALSWIKTDLWSGEEKRLVLCKSMGMDFKL